MFLELRAPHLRDADAEGTVDLVEDESVATEVPLVLAVGPDSEDLLARRGGQPDAGPEGPLSDSPHRAVIEEELDLRGCAGR